MGRVMWRKKIRRKILAVVRAKMLDKIANIWIGEEGCGKVHLGILVIEKLKEMIGKFGGNNRLVLELS